MGTAGQRGDDPTLRDLVQGQIGYFDHDYPAVKLTKRKAYALIRRILGENGIRSTPPPAKLQVL